LRLDLSDLRNLAAYQGAEPVPLGLRALLLGRDLLPQKAALKRQRGEHGGIDILSVGGDLARANCQEGLTPLDVVTLPHIDLGDDARSGGEDLGSAGGWRQIARHGLLARVLGDAGEGNDDRKGGQRGPRQQLARWRLQQRDLAPLALRALEVEGFMPKECRMRGHGPLQERCARRQMFLSSRSGLVRPPREINAKPAGILAL